VPTNLEILTMGRPILTQMWTSSVIEVKKVGFERFSRLMPKDPGGN
jgi:hypothetical protein